MLCCVVLCCAAPDAVRFVMLTYLLTVPGWVGRKTLLQLRGVPPAARQTVSRCNLMHTPLHDTMLHAQG